MIDSQRRQSSLTTIVKGFGMCIVYTSRIAYSGQDRLDTTVKSGAGLGKVLAPTWDLVGGIKHHETEGRDPRWVRYIPITRKQYIEGYYTLLRMRYKADSAPFLALLERERFTICCYCAVGAFCHRHLAVDILEKIALAKGLPFIRRGELSLRNVKTFPASALDKQSQTGGI